LDIHPKQSNIIGMNGPLTTRGVLLQVLRGGPGYGLELIRRVVQAAGLRISEARVYPVLKALEEQGLVRSVRLTPRGRRGGRERVYYHLAPAGVRAAEHDRRALLAVLEPGSGRAPSAAERQRMAERIAQGDELSEASAELRDAGR
jgi:DNA-binding PadR family transcriptional regulator